MVRTSQTGCLSAENVYFSTGDLIYSADPFLTGVDCGENEKQNFRDDESSGKGRRILFLRKDNCDSKRLI